MRITENVNSGWGGGLLGLYSGKIKNFAIATLGVATFALLVGLLADSIRPTSADDSGDVQVAARVSSGSISLTLDNSGPCSGFDYVNNILTIDTMSGSISSGCFTALVSTTGDYGYTLSLAGPASGNLIDSGSGAIYAKSGSLIAPAIFDPTTTGGEWGFAIPGGQIRGHTFGFDSSYSILGFNNKVNTALYASVPTTATPISTTDVANPITDDIYNIYVAVATGPAMATGTYGGTITISAVANMFIPPPPTLTAIAPTSGTVAGGTSVAITGTNFMVDTNSIVDAVSIGAYACQSINVISNTTLTCTTAAGSIGAQDVTVDTEGGTATLTNGFTYTAAGIVAGADIQTVNAANCPTSRTRVIDARDGNSYWVRRINGTGTGGTDLCWMETNLAYRGGGINTHGDVTPAITAGTLSAGFLNPANTASGQVCFGNNASMNTHQQGCFWESTASNITTGGSSPSTSTDGGVTNPQYGLLYNWCAAMNGQAAACQTGAATQPNQNVNGGAGALHNICPLGWRLPTGEPTTGEFTLLNNTINGGLTNSPAGLFTASSLMYSGLFSSASFLNMGTNGYYWSSTVSAATGARNLSFVSSDVNPANAGIKGIGLAVRCVSP